jgi:hypothetical protein
MQRRMRKDMSKVIVERPRHGHSQRYVRPGRTRPLEDEDGEPLRAREPVRSLPYKSKALNENLAPLKRYLSAQVGRPWNKVYSEISANLKPTSTVQQHVRDHIEDFVAIKTRMEAGKVRTSRSKFGCGDVALEDDWRPYYVHPKTGLLRRNPMPYSYAADRKRRAKAAADELAARMRVIDAKTQWHKLAGDVWWEVKLAPVVTGLEVDVLRSAGLSDLPAGELYDRHGVYAESKRVLSKAEKRKAGLTS